MFGLWVAALVIITIGVIGTVVPGLPGMPLVLGGIALFAIGTSFSVIGPVQFGLFVVLGLLGVGLNYLGNLLGARRFGASRMGMLGALIGVIPGLLLLGPVLGPFGLVVGSMGGAIAFEMMQGREFNTALRSGFGVVVGYLFGTLAEVIIAVIMAGWFLWSTLRPVLGDVGPPLPGAPLSPLY